MNKHYNFVLQLLQSSQFHHNYYNYCNYHVMNKYYNFVFFIHLITLNCLPQKHPLEMFYKKSFLKYFAKFTGKYLYQSLFFFLIKKSLACSFTKKEILVHLFSCEHLFYRIHLDNCFYYHQVYYIDIKLVFHFSNFKKFSFSKLCCPIKR